MIKGIIQRVSKAQKCNEGCYGYEPYLEFKSSKREDVVSCATGVSKNAHRSQDQK